MLLRIETDQIYHAVSAITRAKHSGHCSGSQPVRLLQCCLRKSSSLWHPATTVSPQHSRTSGRRLIATRSRNFSATRPPLAASAFDQAVYDGTSLLVRRRTILYGGPDPDFLDRYAFLQFILTDVFSWLTAVCRQSRRYTWSSLNVTQMCHLWLKKFENS